MNANTKVINSLNSLLESNLDDIADLREFESPTPGHYRLRLSILAKQINSKDAIEFNYGVAEVLELVDASATPPRIGDKFSEAYMLNNEIGLGKFKAAIKPIAAALGTSNIRELVSGQVKDLEICATVARRADKNTVGKFYAVVSNITVS